MSEVDTIVNCGFANGWAILVASPLLMFIRMLMFIALLRRRMVWAPKMWPSSLHFGSQCVLAFGGGVEFCFRRVYLWVKVLGVTVFRRQPVQIWFTLGAQFGNLLHLPTQAEIST